MMALTPGSVLEVKAAMRRRVAAALGDHSGEALSWWWVPGRVEVFGKHTDYGGGPSLVGALPRGFLIAGARRPDQVVRVIDSGDSSAFRLDLATGKTEPADVSGWRRYVNVLARRLVRDFPGASLGADLAIASDLPRASGMSSSSALVVGVAHALSRLGRLDERDDWRDVIRTDVDRSGYFACLENGLPFGPFAGDGGVGTFGGSEDQTAIVCSKPGCLSQFTYMPVRHVADVALPGAWTFVLASSGVAAEKAGRAQGLYNRASLGVRALIDVWRARIGPTASLTEAFSSSVHAGEQLRAALQLDPPSGWTYAELDTRLTHFEREHVRVAQAVAAFRAGDAAALGALAAASHGEADRLLGNQIPETNALVDLALREGAFGASAFGGGFGGSVWALVDAGGKVADADAFGAAWLAAYRRAFPGRPGSDWFAARPGPPLTELRPT
jgi:galactokinase